MSDGRGDHDSNGPKPLFERIFAFMETTAMMAAAKVGVPDALAAGPRTAADVAADLALDEKAVDRLLRNLTGTGVIESTGRGRYRLGPLGEFLRSDVPGSARAFYQFFGGPFGQGMLGGEAALTDKGVNGFDRILGLPIFDYMAAHPDDGAVFNRAMVDIGETVGTPPIHAYDFSGLSHIVDVGGGLGQLAREVLRINPGMKGIVYDRTEVIGSTQLAIERDGLADRCQAVAGDFFESVPAGADCYALRLVIHDWDDEKATTILRRCREAMTGTGDCCSSSLSCPTPTSPTRPRAWTGSCSPASPAGSAPRRSMPLSSPAPASGCAGLSHRPLR